MPQGDEANLSPEQLKIRKALEETNFFSKPKFVGNEKVKGEDSYHYSVTLDKKAFLDSVSRGILDSESGNVYSTKELKAALNARRSM